MGVMTLALSVFSIVPAAIAFANQTKLARIVIHLMQTQNKISGGLKEPSDFWRLVMMLTKGDTSNLPSEHDESVMYINGTVRDFFILCIGLLAVYLICSVLMIYGVCKGNRCCLLPWIITTFLYILACLGGCFTIIIVFKFHIQIIIILLAIAILDTGMGLYLWLCIVSLFQILDADEWRYRNDNSDLEMMPRFSTAYNYHIQ